LFQKVTYFPKILIFGMVCAFPLEANQLGFSLWQKVMGPMKVSKYILGIVVLGMAPFAGAQLKVGDNTSLTAGAMVSFGYEGAYGDQAGSNHGLNVGVDGKLSGSYYNPNFLSFEATPYYNQSRANSSYQSLTGASGVSGTANLFTGSNFPGSVSYHYDRNSTGTFGLVGQPNFTTYGNAQGFGINWSALLPNMPTFTVGYSQGHGNSTLYGTNEEADSSTHLFNIHSGYQIHGFRLNGYYDRNSLSSKIPEFLSGAGEALQDSSGHDFGFGVTHNLPLHGSFYVTYNRASVQSDYHSAAVQNANQSNYTDSTETSSATLHPTVKLTLNATQNYTDNLTGYLTQNLAGPGGGIATGINLGTGSHSYTFGGGASYQVTTFLSTSFQATYYDQYYFGKSFTGTYLSGTVNYAKRLWDMFSFSGSIIESSNGQGNNALGFVGNVNFFRRFGRWQTSGQFSYAQNVQTILVTYTSSYYNYGANVHRRLPGGLTWTAAFNGNHSGLTNVPGSTNHAEGFSTSVSTRRVSINGLYSQSSGFSLLSSGGIITPQPTPGVNDFIFFNGQSYGGGVSVTPLRRLVVSGSFSRAISDTIAATNSHNNTEIFNAQMQYHLRRIGLQAGYTRFTQGISAVGAPANTTTYFVGVTRWFDFF
jgi:hypothetical protein